MKTIVRVLQTVFRGLNYVACVALFAIAVLLIANILTRALFNAPIYGTVEGVSYLVMTAVACALPANELAGGNIAVTLVVDRIGKLKRSLLDTILCGVSAVVMGFVTYDLSTEIFSKLQLGDVTENLRIPHWILMIILTVGFGLLTLCFILRAINFAAEYKQTRAQQPGTETAAAGK